MKKQNRPYRGFTLIELMIVIAIIGILAAIAIPNFTKARIKAKAKACVSNMRTIESALEMYMMENASTTRPAISDLASYMQGTKIPKCPTTQSSGSYTIGGSDATGYYIACEIHMTVDSPSDGDGSNTPPPNP